VTAPFLGDDFWDAIFDLIEKYDIPVTNNMLRDGMRHVADFGEDVAAILSTLQR
jgi:hypothetical protein